MYIIQLHEIPDVYHLHVLLQLHMSQALTMLRDTFDKLTAEETDVVLKRIRQDTLAANLSHLGVPVTRDHCKEWFTWLDVSGSG